MVLKEIWNIFKMLKSDNPITKSKMVTLKDRSMSVLNDSIQGLRCIRLHFANDILNVGWNIFIHKLEYTSFYGYLRALRGIPMSPVYTTLPRLAYPSPAKAICDTFKLKMGLHEKLTSHCLKRDGQINWLIGWLIHPFMNEWMNDFC